MTSKPGQEGETVTMEKMRHPALQGGKSIKPGGIYWLRYIIPALLVYGIFMAYPMLDSVRLSHVVCTASSISSLKMSSMASSAIGAARWIFASPPPSSRSHSTR